MVEARFRVCHSCKIAYSYGRYRKYCTKCTRVLKVEYLETTLKGKSTGRTITEWLFFDN
jgi:hypothetical protein